MQRITLGTRAALAALMFCAGVSGAQTTNQQVRRPLQKQVSAPSNPYAFMNSTGFPQEWHSKRRNGPARPPHYFRRTLLGTSPRQPADDRGLARSGRNAAVQSGVAPRTVRRTNLSTVDSRPTGRSVPRSQSSDDLMPPALPRRTARVATRDTRSPGGSGSASATAHARSGSSPYAFMDTTGFPEPYHPLTRRTSDSTVHRTPTKAPPKKARSREAVPPGFIEVR